MKNTIVTTVKNRIKNWYVPSLIGLIFIATGIAVIAYPDCFLSHSFHHLQRFLFNRWVHRGSFCHLQSER